MEKERFLFSNIETNSCDANEAVASFSGIVLKTLLLFIIIVASCIFTANGPFVLETSLLFGLLITSTALAFVFATVGIIFPRLSAISSFIYSISYGVFFGVIYRIFSQYDSSGYMLDVMVVAAFAAALVFAVTLFSYMIGAIRVTDKLRKFFLIFISSILLMSLANLILSFVNPALFAMLNSSSLAIPVAIIIFIVSTISLVMDFDSCARVVEAQCSKRYEWRSALGLMVSMIWIYIQLIRIAVLLRRD